MINRLLALFLWVALAAVAPIAASAATVPVTTSTYAATIAVANTGDVVQLGAGSYAPAYFRGKTVPKPGVTITCAPGAVLQGMRFDHVSGVTVTGCSFDGGGVQAAGLSFSASDHVLVSLNQFTGFVRAAVEFGLETNDSRITGNVVARSGADGFDVSLSRRDQVDHNVCMDFTPTALAHPDCVQIWSRPTNAPTADITISDNTAVGQMQAFSGFNHLRADVSGRLVDDGGFDRITVTRNFALTSMSDGIDFYGCRSCSVTFNTIGTLPGAAHQTHLFVSPESTAIVSDNVVGPLP